MCQDGLEPVGGVKVTHALGANFEAQEGRLFGAGVGLHVEVPAL